MFLLIFVEKLILIIEALLIDRCLNAAFLMSTK